MCKKAIDVAMISTEEIEAVEALFGTIDNWLIWKLTGGMKHAASYSNASVMGSFDLKTGEWYKKF